MLRTRPPVPNNVPIVIPTRRPYGAGALRSVAVDTQGFVQWQGATAISKSGAISIGFGSNIRLLSKSRPVTFTGSIAGKGKGLEPWRHHACRGGSEGCALHCGTQGIAPVSRGSKR